MLPVGLLIPRSQVRSLHGPIGSTRIGSGPPRVRVGADDAPACLARRRRRSGRSRRRRDAACPDGTPTTIGSSPSAIRTTRCGRCRSSRTEARTWRSCSPPRRCRHRGVTSSSTCVSCTRTLGGRCSFRRTSGRISRPPTRSVTRWRLDASTTTCLGRRAPSTRSSTRPSRVSCSSGRGIGASFRRRCTSWARHGPAGPTS